MYHMRRGGLENETRTYLEKTYPEFGETHRGFLAFGESGLEQRANASFYMIVHNVGSIEAGGPVHSSRTQKGF
jgi:hypothetical protein